MLQNKAIYSVILIFLFCGALGVAKSKNVSDSERAARLNFIRNILSKGGDREGAVKLVGGPSRYEGNVHVWHAGRWGAVCDDSWDDRAADVVCSKFNRTGAATRGSQYGYSKVKYWMENIVCQGQETSLIQCMFPGWGNSKCDANEAAGVKCIGEPDLEPAAKPFTRWPGKLLQQVLDVSTAKIRLIGGRDENEGRVEIQYNGVWGSICGDGWTLHEALVTCRHLGLGYAAQSSQTDYFGSSRIVLSGVRCEGNETGLFQCRHRQYGDAVCPGSVGHVAAVVCTRTLADLALDYKELEHSSHLQDVALYHLQCAMEELCLAKSAYECCARGRPIIVEWERDARHSAGLSLVRMFNSTFNVDVRRQVKDPRQGRRLLPHFVEHAPEIY
ncbi:Lysyl oxidase homolog 2 [Eumeta japonica]|uniref:Lysyl oxidase homolog 2 n=1 Tax=Eumeta variegata TaxID=151549 RepID=A0A4C1SVI6_EUMVA|nr:Lysyl oxidase homolog 2 [Eumeta japonica]